MSPPVADQAGREENSSTVRFINAIRDRWWVIVICGLVCASAALAYSLTQTKIYSASASLLFRNAGISNAVFGSEVFAPSSDPDRAAATNQALLTSTELAERVKDKLKLDSSPDDLLANLSVEENSNSDVVEVSYSDPDPQTAARLANAFVTQFVIARREADRKVIADAQDRIRQQLDALPPGDSTERTELETALQDLIPLEAIGGGNAEVVDTATAPSSPSKPAPKQNAALGLILGLALGTALAFALDFLDRRVRRTDDFEDGYGVPILSRIPHKTFAAYDPKRQSAAAFEPYRMLRNALGTYRRDGNPLRVVLVTSAVPDEGKTLVAVNLARAVALTGRDAAIVEADIRDPDLSRHFPSDPGAADLSATLTEGADERSLQRVSPGRWSDSPELPSGEIVVLPAGSPPPNASELMSGPAMSGLLEWLAEMTDLVLVDASPLLPVADTRALLDQAPIDGVVVVARAESTTRDQVDRARAILEQHHGLDVLGVVVTDSPESDTGYGLHGLEQDLISDDAPAASAPANDAPEPEQPAPPQMPPPQAAPAPPQAPPPYAAPPQAPPPYAAPPAPPQAPPYAAPPAYPPAPAYAAPQAYGQEAPTAVYPAPAVPAHGRPWQGNGHQAPPPQPPQR